MSYRLEWARSAVRELRTLPVDIGNRITQAVGGLSNTPRPVGSKKLAGFKGLWRIRIGNYRVIYHIGDEIRLFESNASAIERMPTDSSSLRRKARCAGSPPRRIWMRVPGVYFDRQSCTASRQNLRMGIGELDRPEIESNGLLWYILLQMKFGFRKPSLNKRIAARTSVKRYIRHSLGLKAPRGYGWLTNPQKAAYNRVYNRTTRGCRVSLVALLGIACSVVLLLRSFF